MLLFLILGAMTALAIAFLVLPFLRRVEPPAPRQAHDLAVYRDQLRELEADVANGLMGGEQAKAARIEIERRILSAAAQIEGDMRPGTDPWRTRIIAAFVVAVTVPIAGGGIYLTFGSPELSDRVAPVATQTPESAHAAAGDETDMGTMIGRLSARLAKNPDDVEGWILLARSQGFQGRFDLAAEALNKAIDHVGRRPDLIAALGETMVTGAQGNVGPDAVALFKEVLEHEPGHPAAHYYIGLAEARGARPREGLDRWIRLAKSAPDDAVWLAGLRQQITVLAGEIGADVSAELAAMPQTQTPPGPTAEDVAAAGDMSEADRATMIRSMVERLAQRLEENPNDAEGWRRLAQSYRVLGEDEKAREAMARADAATPATPGPTADDIAAAGQMSAADRMKMIRGMVARLAEKLEENPNEADGWRRLARSYQVLGEDEKAREALKRAEALK